MQNLQLLQAWGGSAAAREATKETTNDLFQSRYEAALKSTEHVGNVRFALAPCPWLID